VVTGSTVGPDSDDVPRLAHDVGAVAGRVHEQPEDVRGHVFLGCARPGCLADVLAGDLETVVVLVLHVPEHVVVSSRARDRVREVVPLGHVLAPPAGDRAQRRVELERPQTARRPGLILQRDELRLGPGADGVLIPPADDGYEVQPGRRAEHQGQSDGDGDAPGRSMQVRAAMERREPDHANGGFSQGARRGSGSALTLGPGRPRFCGAKVPAGAARGTSPGGARDPAPGPRRSPAPARGPVHSPRPMGRRAPRTHLPGHLGGLSSMAEHRIVAPKVAGSSPVGHPKFPPLARTLARKEP
jgi:hypothetical protein